MIDFDAVTVTLRRRRPARRCATSTCRRGGRAVPGHRAAPASASRRCWARSTGWCRTSPAAASPAGSPWPAATPATAPAARAAPTWSAYVGQDPLAGFVTDTVEEELAYGDGAARPCRRRPCASGSRRRSTCSASPTCAHRALRTLSGGQQQRVAIGSVLTTHPRVLVLDEPTSALDPTAAEDVLATITRLVHDLGVTVLLAEHRLERVVQYADRLVLLTGDGGAVCGGAGRRAGRPRRSRRRSSSSAGWPAGRRCRCRSATPAAGPARCATAGRAVPPTPTPRPGRRGADRPGVVVRYGPDGRRPRVSTWTCRAARSSR